MNEEEFLVKVANAIQFRFKDSTVEWDVLNNRIMVSWRGSDDAFDIKVEKE